VLEVVVPVRPPDHLLALTFMGEQRLWGLHVLMPSAPG
jgi:hypothetical protein